MHGFLTGVMPVEPIFVSAVVVFVGKVRKIRMKRSDEKVIVLNTDLVPYLLEMAEYWKGRERYLPRHMFCCFLFAQGRLTLAQAQKESSAFGFNWDEEIMEVAFQRLQEANDVLETLKATEKNSPILQKKSRQYRELRDSDATAFLDPKAIENAMCREVIVNELLLHGTIDAIKLDRIYSEVHDKILAHSNPRLVFFKNVLIVGRYCTGAPQNMRVHRVLLWGSN